MVSKKADCGFLTFAIGSAYLNMARLQAMTIKITQHRVKNFAVVVDSSTADEIKDADNSMFDEIIIINRSAVDWDMRNEWMAFDLSPWRNTFKTDADMIFPASIDHWWPMLQHRNVVIASKAFDFRGEEITSRWHRRLFDENLLPNAYSAMTFFRYSKEAKLFYDTVRDITNDWDWVASQRLIKNDDPRPRTDEIYALSAQILGAENHLMPSIVPSFVHMKSRLNGLSTLRPWYEQIYNYWEDGALFVGNIAQTLPFHYHEKEWINGRTIAGINRDYQKSRASDRSISIMESTATATAAGEVGL